MAERWSSVLETMSTAGLREEGGMSSNTKFSCHAVHGLSKPTDNTRSIVDLRGPELNSTFRLHTKLQKLRNETFDRRAAMQVAQMEGIELGKEVFDLLHETETSQEGRFRRADNVSRRKRWEVYRGLSKIVDQFPMPPCHRCPTREAGVQAYERDSPPVENVLNTGDFGSEVQASLQTSAAPNPTMCFSWPGASCQAQDQSLDEQHWAYLVEACRQTRMDFGSSPACQ